MAETNSLDIKISAEVNQTNKAIDRLVSKLGKLSKALNFNASIKGLEKQKKAFDSLGETIKNISGTMDIMKKSMGGMLNAMEVVGKISENTIRMAQAIEKLSATGIRVSASIKPAGTEFESIGKSLQSMSKVASKASETMGKAMSNIVTTDIGAFSKISQIGIKASNAMNRVAGDMAAAFEKITHSGNGLDTASSFRKIATFANQWKLLESNIQSISYVIGQGLIAAILPAVQWINTLMGKFMEAAKTFCGFMDTLTGYKPENSISGTVGDMAGIGDSSENLGDLGNAAQEAGEKLNKKLLTLPFDELNILSDASVDLKDSLEDVGNVNIGLGGFDDFTNIGNDAPLNKWAQMIRDAFLKQDWEGLGKTIAELINIGLRKIYDAIMFITPKVEQALKNLAKVFNSFVDWLDWELLGKTIGAGINFITTSINALLGDGGIDFENLGKKLSVGFRGMVGEINWTELGNAIGNGFMMAWHIAYGFIEDMWRIDSNTLLSGWAQLGNGIGDTIAGIFERIDFGKISAVITEGFKGILESITYALNTLSDNLDWIVDKINLGLDRLYDGLKWDSAAGQDMGNKITAFTESISTVFNKLLDLDFGKAGQIIGAGITDIVRAFNQLTDVDVGGLDFEKLGRKISDGLRKLVTEIPWEEFGNALGNGFMAVWRILDGFLTDMARENGVGLTGWQELGKGIADSINGLFAKLDLSKISGVISELINGIFQLLQESVDDIRWNDIAENLSSGLNGLIDGIKWKENGQVLNNLLTEFLGMLLKATEDVRWEELGRQIGVFLSEIEWGKHFKTALDTALEVIGGLFDGFGQSSSGRIAEALAVGFTAFNVADVFSPLTEKILNQLGVEGPLAGVIAKGISILIGGLAATLVGGEEFIDAAFGILNGFLDDMINAVKDVDWGQVWNHIADATNAAFSNLPDVIGKITALAIELGGYLIAGLIEYFVSGEAIADLAEFGFNLIAGMVNGILTAIGGLGEALAAIGRILIGGLKELFGIHSPSTVMAEIGVNIMEGLINGIQSLFEGVVDMVKSVVDAVLGAWQGIQEQTEQVWNAVRGAVVSIWSGIRDKATELFNGISEFLKGVFEGIEEAWSGVWQFLGDFLSNTWNFITETARNVFGGIGEFLAKVFDTLSEIWCGIWEGLSEFLFGIWQTITDAAHFAFEGIGEFLSGLFDTVAGIWESIWITIHDVVTGIWNTIKETALSAFNTIKETVLNVWTNIKEKTDELWGAAKKFIEEAIDAIRGWIVEKLGYAADFIKNAWEAVSTKTQEVWEELKVFLFEFIPNMVEKIVGFFAELPDKMFEIAKNIVTGFINGIVGFAETAYGKVKEFAGGIVDKVKGVLGIHSPSKVFEELGSNTVQGYIDGFEQNAGKVTDSAKRVAESSIQAFDGTDKEFNYIGSNMVGSLDAGITAEMQGIRDAMMTLMESIRASFYGLNANYQDIGNNLMHGFINGINNMMGSVQDVMFNVANSITGRFRDALGIHSPSTVFAELGNYSIQGYVKGMSSGDGLIRSAATGIAGEAMAALEKAGDFGSAGASMMDSLISSLEKADISKAGGEISNRFADGISIGSINATMDTPDSIITHNTESLLRQRMEYSGEINERSSLIADGHFAEVIEEAAYRGFSRANSENGEQESLLRELIDAVREGKTISIDGRELASISKERNERNGFDFRTVPV